MPLFIKNISLYNLIKLLAIVYPTSLANLVFEVGTRHRHQIFAYLIKKSVWTGIDAFPMGARGRAQCTPQTVSIWRHVDGLPSHLWGSRINPQR